jgi:hypothetical protein
VFKKVKTLNYLSIASIFVMYANLSDKYVPTIQMFKLIQNVVAQFYKVLPPEILVKGILFFASYPAYTRQ